jgi:hypothetical protein
MKLIYVLTHLVMVVCFIGVLYIGVSNRVSLSNK